MVGFLRKFKNRAIKIDLVNSIFITKSINLQLSTFFCRVFGILCDVDIFMLTTSAKSINREIDMNYSISPPVLSPLIEKSI